MYDLVLLDLEGNSKEDILLKIAEAAKQHGLVEDAQEIFNKILEKERKTSSAVGFGLALPSAYSSRINPPFAFILCRTKNSTDFGSPDNKPVRLILVCLVKNKTSAGLMKKMAQITGQLRKETFRDALLKAKDENEVRLIMKESGKWN